MQISIDRERCVGAGQCVLAEPDVFDQSDEDGRVLLVKDPGPDAAEVVERVAPLCPSRAIGIADN
ncbi:ferredoxin [Dactylosporangium sp. NPDC051541]|uniref:ferredoxin n=1 Tax=Dactylosporangium sp. NPDC051541 TaxID=3363977 RepID=UPI0037B72F50